MTLILDNRNERSLIADVMVVDDQMTSRIIMETILRSIGDNIRIKTYDNALSALTAARESGPPELIIADYKMPEMNGLEFTRQIRRLPECRDVPIIIITVVDDKQVMYEALEAGATDFLTKPVDHYECKVRCRNLLTLRRQQQIIRNRASSLEAQIGRAVDEVREQERDALKCLARTSEFHEPGMDVDPARVGRIARAIADELGMDRDFCELIEIAAMLHDVGKIGIPDRILLKPGGLSDEEKQIMCAHAAIGSNLLRQGNSPALKMAARIASSHHERFEGSGYPAGTRGAEIPIEGRIVAVADIFDSLIRDTAYRPAWSIGRALDEIKALRGRQLDPDCVAAFLRRIDSLMTQPPSAFAGASDGSKNHH